MSKVLPQYEIKVWDECTMAHKKSLEGIFGGALVLLAGDFRQTHAVIQG